MDKSVYADIVSRQYESGDEDMPDAFRAIPTQLVDLKHSVIAARNPVTLLIEFFQLYAALFGFESAVYGFGRWSAFLEAGGRRICQLLWSMYVDRQSH